ncbi:MAG: hypothetical protein ACOYNN_07865 [Terrimicrobiaceae bacterium]
MKWVAAILTLVAVSVTCAIALGFAWTGLSPRAAAISLFLGAAAGLVAWLTTSDREAPRPSAWDIALLTVFALASLRSFLWLLYPVGDEWRVLSPNNLGDMSLHLHFIRYLASGAPFWPESPILAGTPMVYPLGTDLFNSLLLLVNVPVERGLIWTGLVGASLAGWALWRWGGAFGLAAFLFNGGLAGFAFFQTGAFQDYQAELAWKNFFLSMFVTQRGLLYALPAGLLLLQVWRDESSRHGGVPRWLQLFLYATMPVFSIHTFIFLSLVLAVLFLGRPAERPQIWRFVGLAFLPASILVFLVTGGFSAGSVVRFLPGWMQGTEGWTFWVINFGISLPLLLVMAWRVRRDREALCFVAAGLVCFALAFFFSFAPWEWDNVKLLVWAWLICVPFLWQYVVRPLPFLARSSLCVALFLSGAVCLVGGLDNRHGYRLANRSTIAATAAAIREIPLRDRIAVKPDFNHPVILLGRPVYCGYEGHLWSHGLVYRGKFDALQSVIARQPGWQETAKGLDADWLFLEDSPPFVLRLRDREPRPSSDKPSPPDLGFQ